MSTAIRPSRPAAHVASVTAASHRGEVPVAARGTLGRAGRARTASVVALAAVVGLALSGCGLRLETPPPLEPSPDALEQVRARTVADALALEAAAQGALTVTTDDQVAPVLARVDEIAAQHVTALGGVYDSGLEHDDATPSPSPSPSPTVAATTAHDVLVLLGETATTAATDTDVATDGPLARLVGSVAVARADLADRLADALGEPSPAPEVPADVAVPPEVDATVAGPLARAHDEAGYALEVVAARTGKDERQETLAAARAHRATGEAWAVAGGVAGTDQDPRRAQYALPADLSDDAALAALRREVQTGIAQASAAALAVVPAGTRDTYLDGLRVATATARTSGEPATAFPGLAERADA